MLYISRMSKLKPLIKHLFYLTKITSVLDQAVYVFARLKNRKINTRYKQDHRDVAIPSDYFLYETFRVNYEEYINDGALSAREIIEWTSKHFKSEFTAIMEWGCGVGRIVRHIHDYVDTETAVYACDINKDMIEW